MANHLGRTCDNLPIVVDFNVRAVDGNPTVF